MAMTAAVGLAQSPQGMKLYVFSSGALTIGKYILMNLGLQDTIKVPVGFFVVMHPKGNVLFDTGNNDKIITDPSYWGPFFKSLNPVNTPEVAIDAQLAKIGLKPDDITYVVIGHLHLDHGGNVGKFPNSTLIVQKDEIRNAFWPEPGTAGPYIPGDVAPLRSDLGKATPNKYKMVQLTGDMDIFGDGGRGHGLTRAERVGEDHYPAHRRWLSMSLVGHGARGRPRLPMALALLAVAFLVAMVLTGSLPEPRQLVKFAAKGLLKLPPEQVRRVELRMDEHTASFVRSANQEWVQSGRQAALTDELLAHFREAILLMHTSGGAGISGQETERA